jgi:D-galactose 1-dehydrogenase
MAKYRIGIVGLGKITEDQHVPVIRKSNAFDLVAVASRRGLTVAGAGHAFRDWKELIAKTPKLDAVIICTPPQARTAIAFAALDAGKHVMLEKPPAATVSELAALRAKAERKGLTLFTTWHSQYNEAVFEAQRRLAGKKVSSLRINWKEDVRHWHPGQQWIWKPGGFGVFDPGINALSIVTRIMPQPVFVKSAELSFPENRATPIAADLRFTSSTPDVDWRAAFDWRQTGKQTWNILIKTAGGERLALRKGGSRLEVDGRRAVEAKPQEYEMIYERFAELLDSRTSEIHEDPLRLVADAFMVGRRIVVEPFID